MEETLKTIRLLHQLIIALSALLLAFALAPQDLVHLNAAIAELGAVPALASMQNEYFSWHRDQIADWANKTGYLPKFAQVRDVLNLALKVHVTNNFAYHPAFYANWPRSKLMEFHIQAYGRPEALPVASLPPPERLYRPKPTIQQRTPHGRVS